MLYKCHECEKYFRNKNLLNRHIAYNHRRQLENQLSPIDNEINNMEANVNKPETSPDNASVYFNTNKLDENDDEIAIEAQELDLKVPEMESTRYHCNGCGSDLIEGQTPCPNCGEELDWSQV